MGLELEPGPGPSQRWLGLPWAHGHGQRWLLHIASCHQHCRDTGHRQSTEGKDKLLLSFPRSCQGTGRSLLPAQPSCAQLRNARGRAAPLKALSHSAVRASASSGAHSKATRPWFRESGKERAATEREELPGAGHCCCLFYAKHPPRIPLCSCKAHRGFVLLFGAGWEGRDPSRSQQLPRLPWDSSSSQR